MHRSHLNYGLTRRAFTLVELLVVISIIAVLAGILLVALSSATESATRSRTNATMSSFSAACDAFAMEHGRYPGVVPMRVLGDGSKLTSTQNAMLHLMGGCRVRTSDDNDDSPSAQAYEAYLTNANQPVIIELPDPNNNARIWQIAVDLSRISEGPVVNGKPYPPYFSPKSSELVSRWNMASNPNAADAKEQGFNELPDVYDSWGNPIAYLQQQRKSGPLVEKTVIGPGGQAESGQFTISGLKLYFEAQALGEKRIRQRQAELANAAIIGSRMTGPAHSIADETEPGDEQRRWLTAIVAHPAFYDGSNDPYFGTARSKYVLWSPGPDGVFLSHQDGPLSNTGGFDSNGHQSAEPEDIEEFDDIVVYGGG
jgi:prepilin-type N-terminal cleavage/methylation domain-containing protein